MALGATIHHFAIRLSDVDRGVYESLELKVARHPSEAEDHLVTRVLAYCLELTEGIAFSRGLSEPEQPALAVRDLTRELRAWIDIGAPDADRQLIAGLAARLERRMAFDLSVTDAHLFVSLAGATLSGEVTRLVL